jgi:TonB family protein
MKSSLISATAVALALLSAPAAFATSTDKEAQRVVAWTQSIERQIMDNVNYTGGDIAGARREPVVRFTVSAEGRITDVRLLRSSGYRPADAAALRAVNFTNAVRRPPQAAAQTVTFKPVLITPDLRTRHARG